MSECVRLFVRKGAFLVARREQHAPVAVLDDNAVCEGRCGLRDCRGGAGLPVALPTGLPDLVEICPKRIYFRA